jgi:hypothetical protein
MLFAFGSRREAFDFRGLTGGIPSPSATVAAFELSAFEPDAAHHTTTAAVIVLVDVAVAPRAPRI